MLVFLNAIRILGFTLKIVILNRKYIAKITNPITKSVVDNYKAYIYWNKISRKKIGHLVRLFFCVIFKSAMKVKCLILYTVFYLELVQLAYNCFLFIMFIYSA